VLNVRPLARAKRVWLDCDRERIHQVLANLLGNAVKFTPEGGSIYVRLTMDGRRVVFEVADTGPGIPADKIPEVSLPLSEGTSSSRWAISRE